MTFLYPDFMCTDGIRPAPNAYGAFYEVDDLSRSVPLPVFGVDNSPRGTTIKADEYGYVRGFRLNVLEAVWKSGPLPPQPMQSFEGLRQQVEEAKTAAAGSASDASSSAQAAAASAALVGAPAGEAVRVAVAPGGAAHAELSSTIVEETADKLTLFEGDARYQQSAPDLISGLPTPFYVAHRGAPLAAPEQSMESFRMATATGVHVLEADIQRTADNALVAMHDSTLDRTTDGTGLVSETTLPVFLGLDAAADIPWPRISPPATLLQMLAEFGNKRVLMLEPKDPFTLSQMLADINAAKCENSVLIETSSLTVAEQAVAAGFPVWFFWGTSITSPTVQSVIDAGVDYLAAAHGISPTDVATLVGTGKNITIYGVHRRAIKDYYLGLGVDGISSDNVTYIMNNIAFTKRDSWIKGVWGHGLNTNRASLPGIEDGWLTLSTSGAEERITVGEVCPIANKASSYNIDVDVRWKTLPTDTGKALQIQFALNDDGFYNFATPNNPAIGYPNCYQVHFRANGSLEYYKITAAGAGAPIATVSTPALAAGATAHIKIAVTSTGFTITRTDTGSAPITSADTAYRGGYIQIARFSTADGVGQFKNLVIS